MEVALKAWGNSQGIRIPKEVLTDLGIDYSTPLDLSVKNGEIIIAKKYKHKTLEERIKESGKSFVVLEEIDFGSPQGNEVW